MNELQVLVQQEPGVIKWNFEDLKVALQQEMERYESMVYTDETIDTAKKDVAMLRKLNKAVGDKRKEIKNKCLEPYNVIEKQANELTGLIEKPINLISKQVEEYEERRKAAAKKRIMDYMIQAFSDLPQEISKKAQFKTYDSRWENKTAKVSDWQAAINSAHDQIVTALQVINGTDADFREEALRIYSQNLSLPDAMSKVQELQRQKEMLLERQRQREEKERQRREAEAAAKAAMEKTMEAARAQINEEKSSASAAWENHTPKTQNSEFEGQQEAAMPHSQTGKVIESIDRQNYQSAAASDYPQCSAVIRLFGADDKQIKKILDYIKFTGVKYEVAR